MGLGLGPQRADTKLSTKSKKRKWSSNKKSDSLVSGTNTTKAGTGQKLKKQKRDDRRFGKRDINGVTCYNRDKKDHYANKCPKPPKAKN